MGPRDRGSLAALLALIGGLVLAAPASAALLFADDFTSWASSAWGNERGSWRALDGVYDAGAPDNSPLTYTSVTTLPALTDFVVEVDVNALDDGGLWLRSDYNGGNINGVLLITGGLGGGFSGLYWHVVSNGNAGPILGQVAQSGLQGSNVHLKVKVTGDTYEAFVDGSATPLTTLVDATYSSGSVGLYDYSPTSGASSPRGQTFDNFQVFAAVPEPASLLLAALGLIGIGLRRRG